MKAFTAYQPFAFAIVAGIKPHETRPRRTNIRGRVAVHAGLKEMDGALKGFTKEDRDKIIAMLHQPPFLYNVLYRGGIVGTVEIAGCVPVEEVVNRLTERERLLGDYSPGRFAWILRNPIMFENPVPARGQQGWWEWDMKIGNLPTDKCGECPLIDWCGDPYEEPHFCCDGRFGGIRVATYIRMAESSRKGSKRAISEDVLSRIRRGKE